MKRKVIRACAALLVMLALLAAMHLIATNWEAIVEGIKKMHGA
jgi:hypothetical protein